MKLNIGGGGYKLDGYLNVDLCEGADVHHDLKNPLPFDDNSVDEVVAIHVIESFYRWELESIIQDWFRVLKPNGKMTIEFTDFGDCASLYVEQRDKDSRLKARWGMHGDQSSPLPPRLLHLYVWVSSELRALLERVGFEVEFTKEGVIHDRRRDRRALCRKR